MTDRLPHEKGFHVSWDQLHRDARALAWRLQGQGPEERQLARRGRHHPRRHGPGDDRRRANSTSAWSIPFR